MGERRTVKWEGHEVELYTERRGNRCLVLNPSSGVWKIYDDIRCEKENDDELLTQLGADGLLVDTAEVSKIEHSDEFRLLILEVTKSCNLACTYCFEGDKPESYPIMSLETALTAFDIFTDISNSKRIMVEFNGGEALLGFNLIKQAVPELRKAAEQKQVEVRFSLQSNGTTMTEEIADFLVKEKIPVGISIDGHKKYNCNRKYRNGESIDERLSETLKLLKERGVKFSTLSVLSIEGQYNDVYALQKELDKKECRINLLNSIGNGMSHEIKKDLIAHLAEEFLSLSKQITEEEGRLYEANLLYYLMGLLLYNPFMCYKTPCGTGRNQLYINAAGNIYACQEVCYISKGLLGNVEDGADYIKERIIADEWVKNAAEHKHREPCAECTWRELCHACPAMLTTGRTVCEFNKRVLPELIWFLDENRDRLMRYIQYK